jgi:hypothetical protein
VGLADQIVKRLRPILSGENLVIHALNLNGNAERRKLLAMQLNSPDRACVRKSGVAPNKEAPPVSRRGPLSNCPNYRVIVMQQGPGQQPPPPQQPASLDETIVALVSDRIAAIKSRYFMIFSY